MKTIFKENIIICCNSKCSYKENLFSYCNGRENVSPIRLSPANSPMAQSVWSWHVWPAMIPWTASKLDPSPLYTYISPCNVWKRRESLISLSSGTEILGERECTTHYDGFEHHGIVGAVLKSVGSPMKHGHDTDTDTATPIKIWKNNIIQCNYKCHCRTRLIREVSVLLRWTQFTTSINTTPKAFQ
jgi:hypothetical protein